MESRFLVSFSPTSGRVQVLTTEYIYVNMRYTVVNNPRRLGKFHSRGFSFTAYSKGFQADIT